MEFVSKALRGMSSKGIQKRITGEKENNRAQCDTTFTKKNPERSSAKGVDWGGEMKKILSIVIKA